MLTHQNHPRNHGNTLPQSGLRVEGGNIFYKNLRFEDAKSNEKTRAQKVKICQDALFLSDSFIDRANIVQVKGSRVEGTCEWLKENELYQAWLTQDRNELLWISGHPGQGKTMLALFLTQDLEMFTKDFENTDLLYYFCTYQDDARNNAPAILRGLLYQILSKRPSLVRHIWRFFEDAQSEKIRMMLNSREVLWSILLSFVGDDDFGSMFWVIDGLDECDDDSSSALARKFVNLFADRTSIPPANSLKLVIVSRDIVELHDQTEIRLNPDNEDLLAADIAHFVLAKVNELPSLEGFDEPLRERIQDVLLKKSKGTFLWVSFVINELSQKKTCTELMDALDGIPAGLPAMYDRMLLQIPAHCRQTSSLILRWISLVGRPLDLDEIAGIHRIHSPCGKIDKQIVKDQIAMCGPILKIHEGGVSLTHQSASDYLLGRDKSENPVLNSFRIDAKQGHLELARYCFSSLSILASCPSIESAIHESRLFSYALNHWPEHVRCAGELGTQLLGDANIVTLKNMLHWRNNRMADLDPIPNSLLPWSEPHELKGKSSLLHTASALGFVSWIKAILDAKRWLRAFANIANKRNPELLTPLHLAARMGYLDILQLLLNHGADIESLDKGHCSPLKYAALAGQTDMVRHLIKHGADVEGRCFEGRTALHEAARSGNPSTVETLLDANADINAIDRRGKKPIMNAIFSGQDNVVGLFIASGAEIDGQNPGKWMPLHIASFSGLSATVKLLLDCGVDVNGKNFRGLTALHDAIYNEKDNDAVVTTLLSYGADVTIKSRKGQTALHMAAIENRPRLARLLVEHNIDVWAEDDDGNTALHYAAAHANREFIELLIRSRERPDKSEKYILGPFSNAMKFNCWENARVLVENGAHLNGTEYIHTGIYFAVRLDHEMVLEQLLAANRAVDSKYHGIAPLYLATYFQLERAAMMLMHHGASADMMNERRRKVDDWTRWWTEVEQGSHSISQLFEQETALHLAASLGYAETAQILLLGGANANAKDSEGRTPCELARIGGHTYMIELLDSK